MIKRFRRAAIAAAAALGTLAATYAMTGATALAEAARYYP